jgi:hypothetical protein
MLSALMLHEAAKLVFTLHFKMPCCSTWTVVLASTWAASPLPPSAFAPYLSAHYRLPLPLIFFERSSQGALNLHARAPFFLQFNARYSKGSVRLEPNASPAQSDSLLPNEMKQGWGQVPRGHWIIAHSQVNSHDENTAVNVYYQMPFSTAQNKALLLQQVCPHACIRQCGFLIHSCRLLNLLCFRPLPAKSASRHYARCVLDSSACKCSFPSVISLCVGAAAGLHRDLRCKARFVVAGILRPGSGARQVFPRFAQWNAHGNCCVTTVERLRGA